VPKASSFNTDPSPNMELDIESQGINSTEFISTDVSNRLLDLIRDETFIYTPTVSRQTTTLSDMLPFQVRRMGPKLYACVPSNIEQLVIDNYFFKLYLKSLDLRGAILIMSDQQHISQMTFGDIQLQVLHGLGTVMLNQIPKLTPQVRGPFKRGVLSGLRCFMSFQEKCDIRLFKFDKTLSPSELILGSVWAERYPSEKVCLDSIINVIHNNKWDCDSISTYLKSKQDIYKIYGINVTCHKNSLLSAEEQDFLSTDYADILIKDIDIFFNSHVGLQGLQSELMSFTRDLKPYKTLCQNIIDQRLTAIYSKMSKQAKRKKVPIKELINQERGTSNYVNFFNPCRAASLKQSFKIGEMPTTSEQFNKVMEELDVFLNKFKDKIDEFRSNFIRNWYHNELVF
jgi:hypothetical protein